MRHPDTDTLKTPAIAPETWFPLVRAAWTYISVFGPDILRLRAYYEEVRARTSGPVSMDEAEHLFDTWLKNPDSRVPLHRPGTSHGMINWQLLSRLIGLPRKRPQIFSVTTSTGRARRARAERLLAEGRTQPGLGFLTEVNRPDGARGPWRAALQPRDLWIECVALRNACSSRRSR